MRTLLLILWMLFSPLEGFADPQISEMISQVEVPGDGEDAPTVAKAAYAFAQNPAIARFVFSYAVYHGADVSVDLSREVEKGEIPLFLQWDPRWGYQTYGSGYLAMTGCGPTCLSMVYAGLTGDGGWHPARMARMAIDNGHYVWGTGTAWSLMTTGAQSLGLNAREIAIHPDAFLEALQSGKVLICSMRPGDFTKRGHFIVLSGIDSEGRICVRDPNSAKNSGQTWSIDRLLPQVKGAWAYRLAE